MITILAIGTLREYKENVRINRVEINIHNSPKPPHWEYLLYILQLIAALLTIMKC